MSSTARSRLTAQQYLEIERRAEYKSEFLNGEMFAMSGASRAHNLIATNVTRELSGQLRGRPCETYASDMRVKVSETGLYTYPDVLVVCGEAEFEDAQVDTLLNPTVIVEVLSPSTEAYDRGEKFAQFRELASLREYVLITQDRPRIERFRRSEGQDWLFSAVDGLEESAHLTSIGCDLALADVYERVQFPAAGDVEPLADPPVPTSARSEDEAQRRRSRPGAR
jgi:Uma2 family endonuclease